MKKPYFQMGFPYHILQFLGLFISFFIFSSVFGLIYYYLNTSFKMFIAKSNIVFLTIIPLAIFFYLIFSAVYRAQKRIFTSKFIKRTILNNYNVMSNSMKKRYSLNEYIIIFSLPLIVTFFMVLFNTRFFNIGRLVSNPKDFESWNYLIIFVVFLVNYIINSFVDNTN